MSLSDIKILLQEDIKSIEKKLSDLFSATYKTQNIQALPGKRLRPILMLLSAYIQQPEANSQKELLWNLAAAIECLHIASLVHDDIIDDSPLRHGQATIHQKFGIPFAVVIGDILFAESFQLASSSQNNLITQAFCQGLQSLCQGQYLQMLHRNDWKLDKAIYFSIIEQKTGALFSTSAEIGALYNKNPHSEALKTFGKIFGTIFQIVDDYHDLLESTEKIGKPTQQDLEQGEITFPLILLREKISTDLFQEIIGKKDISLIRNMLFQEKIPESVQNFIDKLKQKAKQQLEHFPPSQYKTALEYLIDSISSLNI